MLKICTKEYTIMNLGNKEALFPNKLISQDFYLVFQDVIFVMLYIITSIFSNTYGSNYALILIEKLIVPLIPLSFLLSLGLSSKFSNFSTPPEEEILKGLNPIKTSPRKS